MHCEGCRELLDSKSLRIQVKGTLWISKEIGREPILKLFSFCPDRQCLQLGFYNMQQATVEFPAFRNRVCISKSVPEERKEELGTLMQQKIHVVREEGPYLTEEFYTLDTNSNLIEDGT